MERTPPAAPHTHSLQPNGMHEQVADDREQERDQRASDGNAGVHHPLEYFVRDILLGDIARQRTADALDVAVDDGELGLLLLEHDFEAIIERRPDLGDRVLQRADRPRLLLIVWRHLCFLKDRDARQGAAAGASFAGTVRQNRRRG